MYRLARRYSVLAPQQALNTIEKFIENKHPTTESLRRALVACSTLEAAYEASASPGYTELPSQKNPQEAEKLLESVLKIYQNSDAQITNQSLLEYFSSDYPPSTSSALQVLQEFTKKSTKNVVPELIAMISFRRAVYRADFVGALDVMRHTCGENSNYKFLINRKLAKYTGIWGLCMGSTLSGTYYLLVSGLMGAWDPATSAMICVMFGTYLTALSVYGTLTLSSSKSGLGPVLEWVPGTSLLYRIRHGLQLKMATFATELNRSLPENLGECSMQLLQDLQKINLKPVETKDESRLKEYWARAGSGFEWTEPDQDPAQLLWMQHMDATKQQRLDSAYSRRDSQGNLLSWISEAEREKQGLSIPHASLLHLEELNSQDSVKKFEQELAEDMKRINAGKNRAIEANIEEDKPQ